MKYLGLTGVALANKMTELREDGKRTAPETVSRWVSGANPIDPSLMGWVTEMVRIKANSQKRCLVRLPTDGGLMIAVANPKGGVGKTTVAKNLAAIAQFSLNMKTTLVQATTPTNKKHVDFELQEMRALRINCPNLGIDEVLAYRPEAGEIVIVDVCSGLSRELQNGEMEDGSKSDQPFLARLRPDIYVVPADFDGGYETWSAVHLIQSAAIQDPVQLLHRPRFMMLNTAARLLAEGLDMNSDLFCPFFIPQSVSGESPLPRYAYGEWINEDQKDHFYRLFEHLIQFLGGEIADEYSLRSEMETMTLEELLDLAA